jgi:probable HAF family extracellular repeat protein
MFSLSALVVLCSLATFAHGKDPKIIIRGNAGGGGAPTLLRQCPRDGCIQVGVNFSFTVDHNGAPFLSFNNASGQDWTTLTLTETGVPAEEVSCSQNLYLTCTVTGQPDGSTQIVLGGVKGLNPRNGILAGANFKIGFACVHQNCWPRGLNFTAHANTGFQTVDFPGAVSTFLYGINNAGQMVGAYVNEDESTHGFLLSNGVFTTIDFPGSTLSVAAGINNHGVITGQYNDSDGFGHGFVYSDGEFATRDLGEGYQTFPTAIDDAGDLVGFCTDSEFNFHGCVAFDGPFTLFDFPGATASLTLGIDFQGNKIAGGYGNINGYSFEHGFLYEDGFTTIDFPGASTTVAFGINDHDNDLTVGTYTVSDNNANNGFGLTSGNFSTRNVPGAQQTNPVNLNDSNQVVGWYVDANNMKHGYVMTE